MQIPNELNVLYIEDDEENAELIKSFLKSEEHIKFNISHKCTLKEGLIFLKDIYHNKEKCNIDIILLDLILPNSHGIATYKRVRKVCSSIPVVIISGFEDIAYKCVQLGAQDYLVKPYITETILTKSLIYAVERNKLETEKFEAERKFREVVESSPVGMFNFELKDNKLILVGYNPASDNVLNVDCSQYLGKTIEEAFPNLEHSIINTYMEIFDTGNPWTGTINYKDDNIENSYFKIHIFITSKNSLTISFENITEQVLAQQKYKNLVEITKAAMYELDFATQKYVYVNDVFCKNLGYTKEELLQLGPSDILTKESLSKWSERQSALRRGEFLDNTFEYEAVKKDGSKAWGLITAEYKEDDKGNVIGANVVAIDITDKKLAEKEAKQKEELIFNELEKRIHSWKKEIVLKGVAESKKLKMMSNQIFSITNEVI